MNLAFFPEDHKLIEMIRKIPLIANMKSGLYIHIPICKCRCLYCDFYSQTDFAVEDPLVKGLMGEIELAANRFQNIQVDTIYFGGGTPSCLKTASLSKILDSISSVFGKHQSDIEITIEVNPDDVTQSKLEKYRELGLNRLSMGTQSYHDHELQLLGRRHSAAQNHSALKAAHAAGFENFSIDLIFALPGQTQADFERSLGQAIEQGPKHISLYCLTWEAGTPLDKMRIEGRLRAASEETQAQMFRAAITKLRNAGYIQYEISNFALPGYECHHNLNYWRVGNYLGFGPSAHSHINGLRWGNYPDLKKYLHSLDRGRPPIESEEKLTGGRMAEEFLMLSLRMAEGVDLDQYQRLIGADLPESKIEIIDTMLERGLAERHGRFLRLTTDGILVADEITAKLI